MKRRIEYFDYDDNHQSLDIETPGNLFTDDGEPALVIDGKKVAIKYDHPDVRDVIITLNGADESTITVREIKG